MLHPWKHHHHWPLEPRRLSSPQSLRPLLSKKARQVHQLTTRTPQQPTEPPAARETTLPRTVCLAQKSQCLALHSAQRVVVVVKAGSKWRDQRVVNFSADSPTQIAQRSWRLTWWIADHFKISPRLLDRVMQRSVRLPPSNWTEPAQQSAMELFSFSLGSLVSVVIYFVKSTVPSNRTHRNFKSLWAWYAILSGTNLVL